MLVTFAAVVPGAAAGDAGPDGLLAVRPQLPGRLPFLSPGFTAGAVATDGQHRWRADLFHTSTLNFKRGVISGARPDADLQTVLDYIAEDHFYTGQTLYYFDGETTRLDLSWSRGLRGGWEIGVSVPLVRHGGGSLDSTVDNFHSLFGISGAGRENAPRDAGAMVLLAADGGYTVVGDDLPRAALGDLAVTGRLRLPVPGRRVRGEAELLAKLPTGDPDSLAGSGSADFGASVAFHWDLGRSRLDLGLAYAWLGDLEAAPDLPIDDTITAAVAYQVRLGRSAALQMQVLHSSSPYRELRTEGLSESAGLLAVGPRFGLGRGWILDLALVEDLYHHRADIDLGLLLGATWFPPGGASRRSAGIEGS